MCLSLVVNASVNSRVMRVLMMRLMCLPPLQLMRNYTLHLYGGSSGSEEKSGKSYLKEVIMLLRMYRMRCTRAG